MGKRGPKPTREPTTHIRVPVSIAEALRNAANERHVSIAIMMVRWPEVVEEAINFALKS